MGQAALEHPSIQRVVEGTQFKSKARLRAPDAYPSHIDRLEQHQSALRVHADEGHRLDEIAIPVFIGRHAEPAGCSLRAQADFETVARLRLQVGIRHRGIAEGQVGEAEVHIVVGRRAKAMRVLRKHRYGWVPTPDHAQLWRPTGAVQTVDCHTRIVLGKGRVNLRIKAVMVNAQGRVQAQASVQQAHFILHEQCGIGGLALGEVAHRINVGHDHIGHGTGGEIQLPAVAQFIRAGAGQVDAVGDRVINRSGAQRLARARLDSQHLLLELEAAKASIRIDRTLRGHRDTVFKGILRR